MSKKDWETKTLGEMCEIKGGKRLPKGKVLLDEVTKFPYIRVADFDGNGSVSTNNIKYLSEDIRQKIKNYIISDQDLFVSIAGTIGVTGIVPKELSGANLTENACKLVLKKNIDLKYLYYFTLSNFFIDEVKKSTRTAAQPKLALSRIAQIEISFPQLINEQKQIVKILDVKFGVIEELKKITEQQIVDTEELFESRLEEMLLGDETWAMCTLGGVCSFENGDRGKNYPARSKLHEEGIPFVNAGNLKGWRELDLDGKNFLTAKQYESLGNGKFSIGDILFCLRGSLGKNALVTKVEKGAIASSLVIVRANKNLNKDFLLYYFNSLLCRKMIEKFAAGTAQPNLGARDLKQFTIFVPEESVQEKIVKELDALSDKTKAMEAIFRRKIADLEDLKKSYLEQAFSGNL